MNKFKAFFFLIFFLPATCAFCEVKLPRLISDGMVLQRGTITKIWGWAQPDEKVTVTFNQKKYNAVTGPDKTWVVSLPPQPAGGPFNLTVAGSNTITITNILFGDVWVCSGQSNMELPMERVGDKYAAIIAQANNPYIRQFEVPDRYNFKAPNPDVETGKWLQVNPKDILKFSAVAYFFAHDLYTQYKVPIGLINSALGGSPAEAWISEPAIKKFPSLYAEAQRFKNPDLINQIENTNKEVNNKWFGLLNQTDIGLKQNWYSPLLNDAAWPQTEMPGYWADNALGLVNGAVWFRKEINVPPHLVGKPAKLLLGRIVDADSVFINGKFVGTTGYQYPPRKYVFPAAILKAGINEISVRVINQSGRGGFVPDKPYKLVIGTDSLDLTGTWKYKLGAKMEPMAPQVFVRWKPTGLFNAMIAPLLNYGIKGVIWYQGESNTDNPGNYNALMQTLIQDWRAHWQQSKLPFIYVQLANFMEPQKQPTESNWAALRQAQFNLLAVPNTAMAVAIDAGEWNDIHPLNKQVVGKRLALSARNLVYGDKKVVSSGPIYRTMKREGNKLILTFAHTGSGLIARNQPELKYFAVAGPDKKYVWAKAKITGNQVVVWHDTIAKPVAVRYAWADNPVGANLYNKEQLPASPFEAQLKE